MNELLIATANPKKRGEMAQILNGAGLSLTLRTLVDYPEAEPVEETGDTFLENARLKAAAAVQLSGLPSIADDGGLIIDALDGAPGVHSHRFLGESTSFDEKMDRILEMLRDVPDKRRACRFISVVVIALPDGRTFDCSGVCEGRVAREKRGAYGFGYDPIFFLPERVQHMAELPPEEKHKISHRGKALAAAVAILKQL